MSARIFFGTEDPQLAVVEYCCPPETVESGMKVISEDAVRAGTVVELLKVTVERHDCLVETRGLRSDEHGNAASV